MELPADIRQLIIDCRKNPNRQNLTQLGKWIAEQNDEMFALAQQLSVQVSKPTEVSHE